MKKRNRLKNISRKEVNKLIEQGVDITIIER